MAGMNITTPCHNAPFFITTRPEGPAYMESDVPDEIFCDADGCFNSWNADGTSDGYYKAP